MIPGLNRATDTPDDQRVSSFGCDLKGQLLLLLESRFAIHRRTLFRLGHVFFYLIFVLARTGMGMGSLPIGAGFEPCLFLSHIDLILIR